MDSNEQRQLTELELGLRRDDPALARLFAVHAASTSRSISWTALGITAVLLVLAAVVLVAGTRWNNAPLLAVAVVAFLVAGLPLSGLATRHRAGPGAGWHDNGERDA